MNKTIGELIAHLQAVREQHGDDLLLKGISGQTIAEYRLDDDGRQRLYAVRFPAEKS